MMRDPAMGEPRKRVTRMRYDMGPMGYLSDQIQRELQKAHYPVREFNLYRSPEKQAEYYARGTSRAKPYNGAHQYYGAADLIHEQWAWFAAKEAPDGKMFWNRLWDCVEVVAEKHNVDFKPRIKWDPAHIELANWREMKDVVGRQEPNQQQLDWYFAVTLPKVWKQRPAARVS